MQFKNETVLDIVLFSENDLGQPMAGENSAGDAAVLRPGDVAGVRDGIQRIVLGIQQGGRPVLLLSRSPEPDVSLEIGGDPMLTDVDD